MEHARVIEPTAVENLRYNVPKSLFDVAGILKASRRIDPLPYQKKIRRSWGKRFARLRALEK